MDYIKYGTSNPYSEIFFLHQPGMINFYINIENGAANGPFEIVLEGSSDQNTNIQLTLTGTIEKKKFQGNGSLTVNGVTINGEGPFQGVVDETGFNCAGEFPGIDLTCLIGLKQFHVTLQKNLAEAETWRCFGC